jgi:hypothetical protein
MARFRYALPAKASRIAVMAGLAVVASGAAVAPAFSPPAHAATTYAVSATVPVGAEGSGGGIAVDARKQTP